MKVLRWMPFSKRTSWINAASTCGRRRLDPQEVFQREGLISGRRESAQQSMSDAAGAPPSFRENRVGGLMQKSFSCLSSGRISQVNAEPRAGNADLTHKKSVQGRRPDVRNTNFRVCPTAAGAPLSSRENRGGPPTQKRRRTNQPPSAGKITPIGGERTTEAESPSEVRKTSQRGHLAYKYTYPVPVESSRRHKLGNRVQPGVTAGAGHVPAGDACRDAEVACGQRKLTLRIEIQRHPPQLANTVVESPTAGSTEKQGELRLTEFRRS